MRKGICCLLGTSIRETFNLIWYSYARTSMISVSLSMLFNVKVLENRNTSISIDSMGPNRVWEFNIGLIIILGRWHGIDRSSFAWMAHSTSWSIIKMYVEQPRNLGPHGFWSVLSAPISGLIGGQTWRTPSKFCSCRKSFKWKNFWWQSDLTRCLLHWFPELAKTWKNWESKNSFPRVCSFFGTVENFIQLEEQFWDFNYHLTNSIVVRYRWETKMTVYNFFF